MGKYNLGKSTTKMDQRLVKEGIYINEVKADPIVRNILKELDDVSVSLQKINIIFCYEALDSIKLVYWNIF